MNVIKQGRDYAKSPFIVIWEVTRACALKCLHCRAEAQYKADPRQLTFQEVKALIDQIAELDNPLFVFTGGDPLMRPDLFELARYAIAEKGFSVSMTPSATPRVTQEAIRKAKEVDLSRCLRENAEFARIRRYVEAPELELMQLRETIWKAILIVSMFRVVMSWYSEYA